MDIYDDPDFVQALMEIVINTQIAFMKEQEKILGQLDYILILDDISSFLSENQFRELVIPAYDRIYAEFPNVQHWYHKDADAGHLSSAVADSRSQPWHVGTTYDIVETRQKTQGKVSLCGN